MKLGIIGGTSFIGDSIFTDWENHRISTPFGETQIKQKGEYVFLQRHGNPPQPPHRINHKANIHAMREAGADSVVALNSVGSLDLSIKPGTVLIPDDFISLWHVSTFYDDEMRFMVPEMDKTLAGKVHALCLGLSVECRFGGVYVETRGPRLETRAEINMLKAYGHIVGMTMASEATLCMEYAMPYASLCSVDNYCHGITAEPLTMEEIAQKVVKNRQHMDRLIVKLLAGALE